MHPYFWDSGRRLGFLQDASDRFEIMCRDPRDPHLVVLEKNAMDVVGPDWPARLDRVFVENLGKFRKYDGRSVQDLLRALRNKVRFAFTYSFFFRFVDSFVYDAPSLLSFIDSETPLSGPARARKATRRPDARRIPFVFHATLPPSLSPCAFCDRKLIPAARVYVSVVL